MDGSHFFLETGKTTYLATYHDASGQGPTEAVLLLDQSANTMMLHLGTSSQGTYVYSATKGTSCRAYAFRFKDGAGRTWTYPQNGRFITRGEGSCAEEYFAASIKMESSGGGRNLPIQMVGFPNRQLQFSPVAASSRLCVTDFWGRRLFAAPVCAGQTRIQLPVEMLPPPGLYFCSIGGGERGQAFRFLRL